MYRYLYNTSHCLPLFTHLKLKHPFFFNCCTVYESRFRKPTTPTALIKDTHRHRSFLFLPRPIPGRFRPRTPSLRGWRRALAAIALHVCLLLPYTSNTGAAAAPAVAPIMHFEVAKDSKDILIPALPRGRLAVTRGEERRGTRQPRTARARRPILALRCVVLACVSCHMSGTSIIHTIETIFRRLFW